MLASSAASRLTCRGISGGVGEQVDVHEHRIQHIVEIVRDAGGEATHLPELLQFSHVRLVRLERALGAQPLGLSVQTSDDVADRCRKLAFGIGPFPCAPDVLVADDADDVATLKNRCVEHRRDAKWRQVRRAEFLRHRIAIAVDESNDARALQHR